MGWTVLILIVIVLMVIGLTRPKRTIEPNLDDLTNEDDIDVSFLEEATEFRAKTKTFCLNQIFHQDIVIIVVPIDVQ